MKDAKTIVIFEDESALTLEPLSLTKPVWHLRCGIRTLEAKIVSKFPSVEVKYYMRDYLSESPDKLRELRSEKDDTVLWINGAQIPKKDFDDIKRLKRNEALVTDGRVIAFNGMCPEGWYAGTKLPLDKFDTIDAQPDAFYLIKYPWELVLASGNEIVREARELHNLGECAEDIDDSVILNQKKDIFIAESCKLEPGVVINAKTGPVVLDENVIVGANAVIEGPTYLGVGTQVKPLTHIRASCLGEQCRAGGEISVSIMQGYSNKAHGGFLGHSFIGEWCNLGSGTEISNLKNNYSNVKVQIGSQLIDTGEQFVGLTMGDHSKTAIGTVFNTGTVVGVACIVFGAGFPPRHVPSFNWGGSEKLTRYRLNPTLETAEKVMERRKKELKPHEKDILRWVYDHRSLPDG